MSEEKQATLDSVDTTAINQAVQEMESAVGISEDSPAEAPEAQVETTSEEVAPDYSEEEKEAMSKGWKPKDQYADDDKEWKSAKEYLRDGEYIDTIKNQNKKIKTMEKTMEALVSMNKKHYEDQMKAKISDLELRRNEAIQNGNVEEVNNIEKEHQELQQDISKVVSQMPNAAVEFAQRNQEWFNDVTPENSAMKQYAINKEQHIRGLYPQWSDDQVMQEIENSTLKYFGKSKAQENVNRERPSAVNMTPAENKSLGKAQKYTYQKLPSEAKRMAREMMKYVPDGSMTLDDYAQQLYDTGVIKND